jgi:hypothetical protein
MRALISRILWVAVAAATIALIAIACRDLRGPDSHPAATGPRITGHETGPTVQEVIEAMDRKGFVSPAGSAEPPE